MAHLQFHPSNPLNPLFVAAAVTAMNANANANANARRRRVLRELQAKQLAAAARRQAHLEAVARAVMQLRRPLKQRRP